MTTKQLGHTGVFLPEVGLGTAAYRGTAAALRAGFDAGAAFVDTAECYGTEAVVGQALRGCRERVFVTTKVSQCHFHRRDLVAACDRSLAALGTDYIDLYLLHGPALAPDIRETMGAMESLVDDGKVRFIGVSNFDAVDLREAQAAVRKHRIVANQMPYSLVERTVEDGLLDYCAATGVSVIAYSPLEHGMENLLRSDKHGALGFVARQYGKTPAQVALNWCLRHPHVHVIPKSDSAARMEEACGASGWRLSEEGSAWLSRNVRFHRQTAFEAWLRRIVRRTAKRRMAQCKYAILGLQSHRKLGYNTVRYN